MDRKSLFLCLIAGLLTLPLQSICEEKGKGKEAKSELPASGVLSRSMTAGYESANVSMPWNKKGVSTGLEEQPPMSGSVSKVSDAQWVAKVFNNTEDTYSGDFKVVQRNDRNVEVKSDYFSATLKAKESVERPISSTPSVKDCALELLRWQNLTKTAKEKEEKAAEAKKAREEKETAEKAAALKRSQARQNEYQQYQQYQQYQNQYRNPYQNKQPR